MTEIEQQKIDEYVKNSWSYRKDTGVIILDKFIEILTEKVYGGNLFNIYGDVDVNYTGSKQNLNTVQNGVLTCNANSSTNHAVGQIIETEIGSTYVFSGKALSFGDSTSAVACFYDEGTSTNSVDKTVQTLGEFSFEFVARASKTLFGFATSGGTGAQFTDIKVIKK